MTLSEAAGAVLPGGQATVEAIGTITDNDPTPVLSIAAVAGGGEARGRLVFEVRLSAASGREVTVSWATADGTAAAGGCGLHGGERDADVCGRGDGADDHGGGHGRCPERASGNVDGFVEQGVERGAGGRR